MMRKWMKALFFLPVIWIISGSGVCAKEEEPRYRVEVIQENNKPMLFETGTVLTEEMLPSELTVRAVRQDEGNQSALLELPVAWNLEAFRGETAGSGNLSSGNFSPGAFSLSGVLNLPPGYEMAEGVEDPKLQIIYRDSGPVADLTGRYRGGAVTLWFNRLIEKYPYYGKIPDAGRVWMEYSGDGKNWEREEIPRQESSYLAEKVFDGSPVMIRLYVESGMQAGYSNTIWLPYEPDGTDSNGGDGEESGDKNQNGDDDIGGNRGGGSAVLPQDRPSEEGTETKNVNGGAANSRIPGSTKAAGDTAAGKGTDPSGASDKKQSGTSEDMSASSDAVSGRKSDASASSDAVSDADTDKVPDSGADNGISLRTWIAGIGLLLLCIAAGAGVMKLIGYYRR